MYLMGLPVTERMERAAPPRPKGGNSVLTLLVLVLIGLGGANLYLTWNRSAGKAPSGLATIHLAGALGLSKLGGKIDASPRGGKAPTAESSVDE